MRKSFKLISTVVAVPVLLIIIFFLLFYFPPFQNWAVRQVASYASDKMDMEITVNHVNLEFPLNLGIEGVKAIRQNDSLPQVKDTVTDIKKVVADIQLLPLFRKQIEINELSFDDMKLNTTNFIHEARIKGKVGRLDLKAHGINLGAESMLINGANLKNAVLDIELSDTVKKDSTPSENFWKINLGKLKIEHTDVTVHMPGDTLQVQAYMGNMVAKNGYFDLFKGLYNVQHFDWTGGYFKYDNNFKVHSPGLDYNHIQISDISIGLDSLYYLAPDLKMRLRTCSFKEQSGIEVTKLTGPMSLDSTHIWLKDLTFKTPASSLHANFDMDLNAFADTIPGKFNATVHGSFGKKDLMMFMGNMPDSFRKLWPYYPLSVDGRLSGNMKRIDFNNFRIELPTAFNLYANGYAANFSNINNLTAKADINAHTYNLDFITSMLSREIIKTIKIPGGIGAKGQIKINGNKYSTDLTVSHGGGNIKAIADIDTKRMAYNARLFASAFPIQHFIPGMKLNAFTGNIAIKGRGTDLLSENTVINAKTDIRHFKYGEYLLDNITAGANIRNGIAHVAIDSKNSKALGLINFDALLNSKNIKASVSCDLNHADLYALHITGTPLTASFCANVDFETDLNKLYKVQGQVSDVTVKDNNKIYRPEDIVLDILTRRDTTRAIVDCGDFHLNIQGNNGYQTLLSQCTNFMSEAVTQLDKKHIDQVALRKKLPDARIYFTCGKNNVFGHILKRYGYIFSSAYIDMTSNHVTGLNGSFYIDSLIVDSMQLDTVRFNINSDRDQFAYNGQICNNKRNPQYIFNALFDGGLNENGAFSRLKLYDADNRLGIGLGLKAALEPKGIRISMFGDNPVLGYKNFAVNDSNYVFLGNDRRISANLRLHASDGMGVQIYSNDENEEALQDITISLNKFDLHKILSVLPYTPDISGILNGDYHLVQTKDELSVSSNMTIDNMEYQHCAMGDIGTEFVYMPKADGSHYINGILNCNGNEVGSIKGTYNSNDAGRLDAILNMEHIPMLLANGFIPNQILGFKGYADGSLSIKGTLSRPHVNGELYLDSAYLISQPYGVEMRFDNDPVTITDSKLLFENFQMYSNNDSPLVMSGNLNFSDLNKITIDARMRAQNFELVDSKENIHSEAYGKAFVNFFARMQGRLDNLQMRGKLDILGSTDMTYILRDSPLTTDNQLDELVKFTDFKNTASQTITRPPLTGFNMDISVGINESAHILCALNAEKSNYIDLIGGGDLRMKYNTVDGLGLTGKYTLNNGEMKYSLPVIPLKTFTIQDGSYVQFTGDPMNPKLNITATEATKALVSTDGGTGRSVDFNCGVVVTKTLNNMGLEFIIEAPEDMTVSNQLKTMSKEERGKIAVTMLTTGMYLTDGNTSGFSMNSALSAFLQSQINDITGNALRTLDLSIGMDNTTDASGSSHTDYSFKFAKRFWNNRLRIMVGGKLSTGPDISNQNQTFFDNVSFEYRLNDASTQYLKLFYDRSSYDWLEGSTGKYGGGFVWRRKLQYFKDIFRFKEEKVNIPVPDNEKKDSIDKR